jgi:xylan 1,4-beta-xylosidase
VITNPILPGFHPDPSIVRVGEDYYLASSTFEWCPGVRLHHSRDLVHWRPLGGALAETRLLDLAGVPDSGGVWAPDLTYANGRFHLVYSVVDNYAYGYKDVANYLVTATDPQGPWSDPVRLHGRGFDAALFHDDDGSTWYLSMQSISKPGRGFSGIEMQRLEEGRLVGEIHRILDGSPAGVTEGPHLYKKDGWYYLLIAEGGTGYNHGAAVARSRDLLGPYELDPNGPLITTRDKLDLPLQKAGHGCFVETQAGEWYLTFLTSRPYTEVETEIPADARARDATGRSVLGRETAITPVEWADGWPRVAGAAPAVDVPAPDLPAHPWPVLSERDDFDAPELDARWSTLRRHPSDTWMRLDERQGHLRVYGGQGPFARREPSLVAQRVTAKRGVFEAGMEFTPQSPHQIAGAGAYYNAYNWYFLQVSLEDGERVLDLVSCDRGRRDYHRIGTCGTATELRIVFDGPVLRFAYREAGGDWKDTSQGRDATTLSDEYASWFDDGVVHAFGFTGAFVGLWVQDFGDECGYADFDYAEYRPEP